MVIVFYSGVIYLDDVKEVKLICDIVLDEI